MTAILLTVSGGMLTSCDSDTLSSRLAKNGINKELAFRDSSQCVEFNTGYYEVDDKGATQLKQLANAKMITYKIETIIEKKKRSNYSWYSGYTYYYEDVEHKFATVSLTKEGRKYKVYRPVTMREEYEDLLKIYEEAEEETPDYMIVKAETETQPQAVADTAGIGDASADAIEEEPDGPVETNEGTADEGGKSDYEKALEKVNVEEHSMLAGRFELIKVINIYCPEEMQKNGKGQCEFIYEFTDKTPFGFVLGAPTQHKRCIGNASLIHLEDNGWIVTEMDLG